MEKKSVGKKFGGFCLLMLIVFFCGFMVGIHRNVIKACIKGEELPEAPSWHFWCKK